MYDPALQRYEVPLDVPIATRRSQQPKYSIEFVNDTFSFTVARKDNSKTEMQVVLLYTVLV